jgi:hypothetical protein
MVHKHTDIPGAAWHCHHEVISAFSVWPGEILTGAINHSRGVLLRSPCGVVPQELFSMAKMRYFRGTGMIFPRLALL